MSMPSSSAFVEAQRLQLAGAQGVLEASALAGEVAAAVGGHAPGAVREVGVAGVLGLLFEHAAGAAGDQLGAAPGAREHESLDVPFDEVGEERAGFAGGRATQRFVGRLRRSVLGRGLVAVRPVPVGVGVGVGTDAAPDTVLGTGTGTGTGTRHRSVVIGPRPSTRAIVPGSHRPIVEPGARRAVLGDRGDVPADQAAGGELRGSQSWPRRG